MGWKKYLKESAKTDKEQRDIARDIYKKIKAHLKLVANNKKEISVVKQYRGFALNIGQFDSRYNNLHLILTPKEFTNGYGRTPSGTEVILLNSLLGDFNTKYIDTRFTEKLFIHEFIHYLDDKRMGVIKQKSGRMYDDGNIKDYFNSPQEFNAYYQEGVSTLDFVLHKKLKNNLQKRFKEELFKSPENFYKFAMGSFFKDFIKNLNGKNMKKLKKRLFGFYTMSKERYM